MSLSRIKNNPLTPCLWVAITLSLSLEARATSDINKSDKPVGAPETVVVVTGTRTPRDLADSPVSIEVIDGEVLQQVSQTTVAQALDIMPGVVVKRSPKDGYNVYMQGFSGDRVLILLDGQPLISPTGAAVDLDQISAADIERIEIVRGAGSVLYGSSAMGGVINIITKKSDVNRVGLNTELGSYSGNKAEGNGLAQQYRLTGRLKRGSWRTGLSAQYIDDTAIDYDLGTDEEDAAALTKEFAKFFISRDFSQLNTEYRVQVFNENKKRSTSIIPGQSKKIYYISDVEQVQHDFNIKGLTTSDVLAGDWKVNTRYVTHEEVSGQSNSKRFSDIRLFQTDAQKMWSFDEYEIVGGVVIHADALNQYKLGEDISEVDDETKQSIEGYSQLSWATNSQEWLAGLRVQNDTNFGNHSAVRLSNLSTFGANKESKWQWRTGLGQSYRVPTLKELYYVFDHSNLSEPYVVLGNKNLDPETAVSINTTLTFDRLFKAVSEPEGNLQVEVNLHYTEAENFITTTEVDASEESGVSGLYDNNVKIFRYKNYREARIYGLDFSTEYHRNNWRAQLSYSYLYATDENKQRLPDRPKHQIKANYIQDAPRYNLKGMIYVVYEKDEFVPEKYTSVEQNDWFSLNANVSQKITKKISWRAGVDNVLNEKKESQEYAFDLRPVVGRKIFIGLNIELL